MSLQIKALTIYHNNQQPLVENVNLTIQQGEVMSLMGPSGCGKSTLLSVIAGHLSHEFTAQGDIFLDKQSIMQTQPHKRQIGILFQDDLLFPHLNIWENIAFALPNKIKGRERKKQAMACLEQIKLENLAESMPHSISGGQRARVSLLRMLQAQPKAVLLDEPFSKLDMELRGNFRAWVFEQLRQANIPTLMVTHDQADVPEGGQLIQWHDLTQAAKSTPEGNSTRETSSTQATIKESADA